MFNSAAAESRYPTCDVCLYLRQYGITCFMRHSNSKKVCIHRVDISVYQYITAGAGTWPMYIVLST